LIIDESKKFFKGIFDNIEITDYKYNTFEDLMIYRCILLDIL